MGAQSFITRQRGVDPRHAYTLAVETAISENGHDPYNGTISTTYGFTDVTKKFYQSKKDKREFIHEMLENAPKGACYVLEEEAPVNNNNKVKSVVEHNVIKGTSKWELRYIVYDNQAQELKVCKTKTEAVGIARNYAETRKVNTRIVMAKVLVNQNPVVAQVKYKKSTQERDGLYTLFGMASC